MAYLKILSIIKKEKGLRKSTRKDFRTVDLENEIQTWAF
jgi:hypothetical protein